MAASSHSKIVDAVVMTSCASTGNVSAAAILRDAREQILAFGPCFPLCLERGLRAGQLFEQGLAL